MENKKNPSKDIHRHRGVFFAIGLLCSLFLVLSAFESQQAVDPALALRGKTIDIAEPITEIKPIEEPKEKPPKRKIDFQKLEVVLDNEKDDSIPPFDQEKFSELPMPEPAIEEESEPSETIILFPEVPAEPDGGFMSFYRYVAGNIHYPPVDRRMGIEGKVFVEFVIEKDGSITQPRVVKGISSSCDAEALRVVSESPRWKPGRQRGVPVRQRFTLPIIFRIQ